MEKMSRQKLDNINRNKMRLFQKCERYVGPDKDMMFEILCDNKDWIPYLPPNNETFFSILGLDRNLLSGDKRDIETIIREKYRHLDKTHAVNLAYSILKNEHYRNTYIWWYDLSK